MKFKAGLKLLYAIILLWLMVDMLFRRWILGRIPPQVPSWVVYATVALDGFLMWALVRRSPVRAASTKTEKS